MLANLSSVLYEGHPIRFSKIDFGETRECQGSMTYHEMIHIPDETLAMFEKFEQDYLADVFRIWDCYAQD